MSKFKTITIFFLCFLSVLAFLFSSKGIGIWRIIHLITMPADLFEPIISDTFRFHKNGYIKEYQLKPKYRDYYEIIITSKSGFDSAEFAAQEKRSSLQGQYKIELFRADEKISEETVGNWSAASFKGTDLKAYRSLSIYEFPLPIKNFKIKNIRLRFSVIKPSLLLERYKNDVELQIRVSARK